MYSNFLTYIAKFLNIQQERIFMYSFDTTVTIVQTFYSYDIWTLPFLLQETEEFLSALVVNKTIQAKIDRLAGIIHFQRTKDPNDILNDWSFNINSLMSLLNKTTHLITKEEMIHKLY